MIKEYKIAGMTCNGCRTTIETALNKIPGIEAEATLSTKQVKIHFNEEINKDVIQEALLLKGNYILEEI